MIDLNYIASRAANAYYMTKYSKNTVLEARTELDRNIIECAQSGHPAHHLAKYILPSFNYEKDRFDFTNDPVLFQIRRKGDCDDFSNYCAHILSSCRIECQLLAIYAPQGGHMVCTFKRPDNALCHISNWSILDDGEFQLFDSIEHIASTVFPAWSKYIIRDPKSYKIIKSVSRK